MPWVVFSNNKRQRDSAVVSWGNVIMTAQNIESMAHILAIELLEAAVNQVISYDRQALELLSVHAGRVVSIKITNPDFSFYMAICEKEVQLFSEHEGPVDARLKIPSSLFARYVLGVSAEKAPLDMSEVVITGDAELLAELMQVALDFSLWVLLKRIFSKWLPDYKSLDDVLRALREHEPAWLSRLDHLPQLVSDTVQILRAQREVQRQQLTEIMEIKQQLAADRKAGQVGAIIGVMLIMLVFAGHLDELSLYSLRAMSHDSLVILCVAAALLVPRLFRRKR